MWQQPREGKSLDVSYSHSQGFMSWVLMGQPSSSLTLAEGLAVLQLHPRYFGLSSLSGRHPHGSSLECSSLPSFLFVQVSSAHSAKPECSLRLTPSGERVWEWGGGPRQGSRGWAGILCSHRPAGPLLPSCLEWLLREEEREHLTQGGGSTQRHFSPPLLRAGCHGWRALAELQAFEWHLLWSPVDGSHSTATSGLGVLIPILALSLTSCLILGQIMI